MRGDSLVGPRGGSSPSVVPSGTMSRCGAVQAVEVATAAAELNRHCTGDLDTEALLGAFEAALAAIAAERVLRGPAPPLQLRRIIHIRPAFAPGPCLLATRGGHPEPCVST